MAKESKLNVKSRCFLYSPDCPTGKIFEGADAIAAAEKDGWVDAPGKVKAKPAATKSTTGGAKKAATNENS